jgi:hypothetical protein
MKFQIMLDVCTNTLLFSEVHTILPFGAGAMKDYITDRAWVGIGHRFI